MSFAATVRKTWERHLLFSVLVELTYRCNLDCFFCYNDLRLAGRPLSRQQYYDLLAELAELGVLQLVLTGGEPLAHPDFFALGSRARELGFVVRVKSNGHALRGALARRLRSEVDPFVVEVSLHGARAATHDRQTRVPGSFERLLANLEEMLALGLRVKLNSTLTRWNEGEIEEMMDLAERLGAPIRFDPEVTPRDDGDREPLDIAPSREGLLRLFRLQRERAARQAADAEPPQVEVGRQGDDDRPAAAGPYCGAGSAALAIDPYGNVYPCVQWRRPVGNLHRQTIREIWSGSSSLGALREENREAGRALAAYGADAPLLGFCPGAAAKGGGRHDAPHAPALERLALQKSSGSPGQRPRLPIVG